MDAVADRIFTLTKAMGMEQKKFAEILGTTDKKVSAWKTGRSKTYRDQIEKIAEVLNTTTEYLLTGVAPKRENASAVSELDTLPNDALDVARAYQQADEKSRAMVRLALGISRQEYIYLPPQGDDKYFCTPKDKSARIAARNGMIIKVPSPTSAEKLDELSKATEKAAEKENDQY